MLKEYSSWNFEPSVTVSSSPASTNVQLEDQNDIELVDYLDDGG